MKVITVRISDTQHEMLSQIIESGFAINEVDAIQKGIILLAREVALESIERSRKEIKEGKCLSGDLDVLAKMVS